MFRIYDGRERFYQWDTDRKLIVNDASITQVHFCNKTDECSLVCATYAENGLTVADVPNILLQDNWAINVYAYDKNYTKFSARFEVEKRTKPADYVYTETEVLNYENLMARLDDIEGSIGETVEEYLVANPPEVNLDGYATKDYVDEAVGAIEIPETDLSDYATKKYVDDAVAAIDIPEGADIDLSQYALKTDIPTTLGELANDTNFITEDSVQTYLESYALKTEVPDVSGFTTEEDVNSLIDAKLAEIGVAEEGAY